MRAYFQTLHEAGRLSCGLPRDSWPEINKMEKRKTSQGKR
jgi:hypothetical protein